MKKTKVVCIGAGPAGLTAGYLLAKNCVDVLVLEADTEYVGGISKTVNYKGYRFDIGGHRFFSKSQEVEKLWDEILPKDMLIRPRSSKIYYNKKFFSYPLKPLEALWRLGIKESVLCVLSYVWAKLLPASPVRTFEQWVSNQFGKRLFSIFFESYTEKVWGMKCSEISADWAAQRINGLSLGRAIYDSIFKWRKKSDSSEGPKTLITSFRYPCFGPGMMWEAAAQKIQKLGGTVKMGCKVTRLKFDASTKLWQVFYHNGTKEEHIVCEHVVSSAAIGEMFPNIEPRVPEFGLAKNLLYRDFVVVALIAKERGILKDNWIYIHDPNVKVGRVQNFKSWSPDLVPVLEHCVYGFEYFCFAGDEFWNQPDDKLIELATSEALQLGILQPGDVLDANVIRQAKAYPVYNDSYQEIVDKIRKATLSFPGLHLVGRNGMHKYNNQDHSMMTAVLTVKNIVAGSSIYDVWSVNQDAEYHESNSKSDLEFGLRQVPRKAS